MRETRAAPGVWILVATLVAAVTVLAFLPPITQDPEYHRFADLRNLMGVPHALDVLSNVPFVVVGAIGLVWLARNRPAPGLRAGGERLAFLTMLLGIAATGFGSAWYHHDPGDASLFWDRLPMTLVFTGLLGLVLGERVPRLARRETVLGVVALGVGSVLYWRWSGDLRPYVLVQFYPFVAIPVLVLMFEPPYTRRLDLLVAGGWYALAKVLELLDSRIYEAGEVVSGHTLKHLAAAVSIAWMLRMVRRRVPIDRP